MSPTRPQRSDDQWVAFADVVRSGKALSIGVSEWTAGRLRAGHARAREPRVPLISNQPQFLALWRVIEDEVVR
ncbi:aldo/keto reductase [Streptomyces brevispora]|uniref:aldo/keto reductase n=1 Tax=Streptomyces brevispora TaxID=887462 RepID=UPI003716FE95